LNRDYDASHASRWVVYAAIRPTIRGR
jgi:hypothetical protein